VRDFRRSSPTTPSLRYLDTFVKLEGSWYFAERNLVLDWSETRTMTAPAAV
jgi:hypothetical protein